MVISISLRARAALKAALLAPALLALTGARAAARSVQERPAAERLAAIEQAVDARRQELHIPGAALAIVQDDRVIDLKGFGLRDLDRRLPVTPDTLFAIGSATKAFTAATVMMSAEEGKLRLDDRPSKYVRYFKLQDPDADAHITVEDLLCHRSGLPRADLAWYTGKLRSDEVIRLMGCVKPTAKLREKFQYQNAMYLVAGTIVSRVQHTPWEQFVSRRILKPLAMNRTTTSDDMMERSSDYSLGYTWDERLKAPVHLPMRKLPCIAPAGAIDSSARDMAQWLRLMLGGGEIDGRRLFAEASYQAMTSPHMKFGAAVDYGYGWFLRTWDGHRVLEHGGNIDGFNSEVAYMPDQHVGFVLLTNVSVSSLGADTMEIVWNELVGKTAQPAAQGAVAYLGPPGDPLQDQGTFHLAAVNLDIDVHVKDGKLTAQPAGQPQMVMTNVGGRRYRLESPAPPNVFFTFRPAKEDPKSTELVVEQSGMTFVGKRRDPAAFESPISAGDLMRRTVQALGGEAALRRHTSSVERASVLLENQGVLDDTTTYAQAPNRRCEVTTMRTVTGKRIATERDYFDGRAGFDEVSFLRTGVKSGDELADAAIDADFYRDLDWQKLYKTVKVVRMEKVGGEDAYVVEAAPQEGAAVTEWVSTATYLPLKRKRAGQPATTYSDYRTVDRVKVPFTEVTEQSPEGRIVKTVREVRFNVPIRAAVFRRSDSRETPAATLAAW